MAGSSTSPLRLDSTLVAAAKREGLINKRSAPKQIEFWAELGKAVEHVLNYSDIFAVIQGLKKIKVESVTSQAVDTDDIFNALENSRQSEKLADNVTSAGVYFEASRSRPGLLDRVDAVTGERQTGRFYNGKFRT
jgi:hypothetical protein